MTITHWLLSCGGSQFPFFFSPKKLFIFHLFICLFILLLCVLVAACRI